MVLQRFAILLDSADAVYFPGQSVTGVVHVWNSEPKALKGKRAHLLTFVFVFTQFGVICEGIYAECRGLSRVHFTKEEGQWRTVRRNRRNRREFTNVTVHYQSHEDYFYHKVPLFDHGINKKLWRMASVSRLCP